MKDFMRLTAHEKVVLVGKKVGITLVFLVGHMPVFFLQLYFDTVYNTCEYTKLPLHLLLFLTSVLLLDCSSVFSSSVFKKLILSFALLTATGSLRLFYKKRNKSCVQKELSWLSSIVLHQKTQNLIETLVYFMQV